MREAHTEVLVVGAGPIGLWTALLLAEAGIQVTVIDQEERTTARAYACALHPRTLHLLDEVGLATSVLEHGRRIPRMAFYEGAERRAEIDISRLEKDFPFLVILPQHALENVLEQRLRRAGVAVHWNHRFASFLREPEVLAVTVEELAGTSTGYIVPHWEMTVSNRRQVRSQFLVGADGHASLVRSQAGIECERTAGAQLFAAFEFESGQRADDEIRVAMDSATTNALWPLLGNKHRWTFQILRSEIVSERPEKERRAVRLARSQVDEQIREYVEKVAHQRAPWFTAGVKEVTWCTQIAFEQRMARQFGRDRCWLAGDAAHQTGPVGVQSMNLGFAEASALVAALRRVLRKGAPASTLESLNTDQRAGWTRLLGLTGGLKPRPDTDAWIREHAARLLSCLPGSDGHLTRLADQLRLDLA